METPAPAKTLRLRWQLAVIVAGLILAGMVVSVLLAWVIAYLKLEPNRRIVTLIAVEGDSSRSAEIVGNSLMCRATVTSTNVLNWAPQRAAGPPDTKQMGDIATAWASDTPDGQQEWLELTYAVPVAPQIIRIYETNAPGALVRVTVFDSTHRENTVWSGADPARPDENGISVANVLVSVSTPTSRIRLYLDSPRVQGWNEIDAVGLLDANGKVHWASSVRASSTYAARGTPKPPMNFAEWDRTVPSWVRCDSESTATRTFEAYGWPMLAVAMEQNLSTSLEGVPLQPVWRGLLVNGIIYGTLLGLLYLSTFRLRRFVRESLWLRRGCCMRCGYDLRFDLARGCPECGWRREEAA